MKCFEDEIRLKMKTCFFRRQEKKPNYSLRNFSKRLEISPAATSQIMNGSRPISLKMAEKIVANLELSVEESQTLLAGLRKQKSKTTAQTKLAKQSLHAYAAISADQMEIAGNWIYFAILSMMELEEFLFEPKWIAGRLNVDAQSISAALKRLERAGFIQMDEEGSYIRTKVQLSSGSGTENVHRRKHNLQNLELAENAIMSTPLDLRDFSHMTLCLDPADIPMAKMMLKEFRREFTERLEARGKKEVYKLCLQLFPLTKTTNKKEGK